LMQRPPASVGKAALPLVVHCCRGFFPSPHRGVLRMDSSRDPFYCRTDATIFNGPKKRP
jgi:hypothetical protein